MLGLSGRILTAVKLVQLDGSENALAELLRHQLSLMEEGAQFLQVRFNVKTVVFNPAVIEISGTITIAVVAEQGHN